MESTSTVTLTALEAEPQSGRFIQVFLQWVADVSETNGDDTDRVDSLTNAFLDMFSLINGLRGNELPNIATVATSYMAVQLLCVCLRKKMYEVPNLLPPDTDPALDEEETWARRGLEESINKFVFNDTGSEPTEKDAIRVNGTLSNLAELFRTRYADLITTLGLQATDLETPSFASVATPTESSPPATEPSSFGSGPDTTKPVDESVLTRASNGKMLSAHATSEADSEIQPPKKGSTKHSPYRPEGIPSCFICCDV